MKYDSHLIPRVKLELLEKRYVGRFILPVREIRGIALARIWRAIALQLDEVHAKIFEIEQVPLVTTRKIGVGDQTNYD